MLVGCAQPRLGDDRIGKCRQNLADDPGMNLPELGHPVRTRQALPLIFDECEEGQDRGQLARGDDSVGAMEAPPERLRTGRTNLGEGTAMEARTSGEPDILFAVEQWSTVSGGISGTACSGASRSACSAVGGSMVGIAASTASRKASATVASCRGRSEGRSA